MFGSGNRRVAGCLVTDGNMRKDAIAVVKRGKRVVAEVRRAGCGTQPGRGAGAAVGQAGRAAVQV